jgi:hypothetical protein
MCSITLHIMPANFADVSERNQIDDGISFALTDDGATVQESPRATELASQIFHSGEFERCRNVSRRERIRAPRHRLFPAAAIRRWIKP